MTHYRNRFWRHTVAALAIGLLSQNMASGDEPVTLPKPEPPPGAIVLFSGNADHGFTAMDGGPLNWRVAEGSLVSTPNGRRSNHAISRQLFRDFKCHVEFRQPEATDGNSGVYFQGLYEIQILKAEPGAELGVGDLGAIYNVRPPDVNAARPAGKWNTLDVRFIAPRRREDGDIVELGRLTAWLNGVKIHDEAALGEPRSPYNPYIYDTTEHLQAIRRAYPKSESGPIVLQDHDSPVAFRNVWVVAIERDER